MSDDTQAAPTPEPAAPDPWTPAATPPPTPPRTPWYRRPLTGVIAAVGAVLAYTGVKFVIGFLAVSVIGSAVSGAFGDQWDRMPSDVRNGLESRLDDAYGDTLDDLSEEAAAKQVENDLRKGMARLDDDRLIRRLALFTSALNKAPVADCGSFMRSNLAGNPTSDAVADHIGQALSQSEYQEWAAIAVAAIEAETSGNPATRTIPDSVQNAAFEAMFLALSEEDYQMFLDVVTTPSTSDADACEAGRIFYSGSLDMDRETLAVIALVDARPAP